MKYKGVVIGCGAIGALLEADSKRPKPATHAGAFKMHPEINLVALVDANETTLTEAQRLFPGVKTYTDSAIALAEVQPHIVSIATPADSHYALIKLCVEAGVQMIVCEKPLAENSVEAKEISNLVQSKGITLVLNYQRRFFPLFQEIQKNIADGRIGSVQRVVSLYSNGLYNNGGHAIDAILFLLKETNMNVEAVVKREGVCPRNDFQVDAFLKTQKGIPVTLMGLDQEKYGIHDIHIYGENGAYFINEYGYSYSFVPVAPSLFAGVNQLDIGKAKGKRKKESMVKAAIQEVIDSHEGNREPKSGLVNGSEVTSILDAITACITQNKAV